jgi:hypothetical protein
MPPERRPARLVVQAQAKEQKMDRPEQDKHDVREQDLDDERPGFTPSGRREEDAEEDEPSTMDRHWPSALGGEVATRSKVKQDD